MEPEILILLGGMFGLLALVAVFFVLLLIRLINLSKGFETTVGIINDRLPETLDNLTRLVEHAESSLDELDRTLRRVQEPIDNFGRISTAGQNLISGVSSALSGDGPQRLLHSLGSNFSRVLAAAVSGGIIALIRKLIAKKFAKDE